MAHGFARNVREEILMLDISLMNQEKEAVKRLLKNLNLRKEGHGRWLGNGNNI